MDEVYKQAQQFEYRLKAVLDQPNRQVGRWLRDEIIRLMDDIETKKNPHSIESRVQGIKRQLESLNDNTVMDSGDQDDLKDRCDSMIQLVRKFQ